ncbi:MAG: glycine cleavage system protein GcvH [Lentisphaeria bacterium]|nr:glycine cleavage system protein GcvH [Lentisphaeria bacterium]
MRFAKSHEWARREGDTVTVGITAYAVEQLGDVVYLDLPRIGARVTAGAAFGEIESVKAASELFAPVDGEVVAVNGGIEDDFDILKADPYGEGWMIRIRTEDAAALDALMTEAEYHAFVKDA